MSVGSVSDTEKTSKAVDSVQNISHVYCKIPLCGKNTFGVNVIICEVGDEVTPLNSLATVTRAQLLPIVAEDGAAGIVLVLGVISTVYPLTAQNKLKQC